MCVIYLIEELWQEPAENRNASGYRCIGYLPSKELADAAVSTAGTVVGTGWPLEKGAVVPKLRARPVTELKLPLTLS